MISEFFLDMDKLVLRRIEEADQPLLINLFCDPAMMSYLGEPWSMEQVNDALHEWHQAWGINNYWYGVVTQKSTAEVVGIAGCAENTQPDEPGLELSWFILPEHQQRGYASEITQGFLRIAFEQWGVERVFAETHPENEASNRLLEKLHFCCRGERQAAYDYLPGFDRQVLWDYSRTQWLIDVAERT